MTCILGIHSPGVGTVLGADSRSSQGHYIVPSDTEKLSRLGPWLLGVSGEGPGARVILAGNDDLRLQLVGAETAERFAYALAKAFDAEGWRREGNAGRGDDGLAFLLARADGLWLMGGCLAVVRIRSGQPVGIGSGGSYGEAAAWSYLDNAGQREPEPPRRRMERAVRHGLRAATVYDSGSGGRPVVEWAR